MRPWFYIPRVCCDNRKSMTQMQISITAPLEQVPIVSDFHEWIYPVHIYQTSKPSFDIVIS